MPVWAASGMTKHKLLAEVETQNIGSLFLLQHLFEQHAALGAALASLSGISRPSHSQRESEGNT